MCSKREGEGRVDLFFFPLGKKPFHDQGRRQQQCGVPVARNDFHFVPERYAKFTGELAC